MPKALVQWKNRYTCSLNFCLVTRSKIKERNQIPLSRLELSEYHGYNIGAVSFVTSNCIQIQHLGNSERKEAI